MPGSDFDPSSLHLLPLRTPNCSVSWKIYQSNSASEKKVTFSKKVLFDENEKFAQHP